VSGRIVFLDTETTGLSLDDDIWDFAAIVREPGQPDSEIQTFIRHDPEKARRLPPSFLADYQARYEDDLALHRQDAAHLIADLTAGRTHVVGAVPNFDTERLALLLRRYGIEPGWHYHLIDVENLAVGYLAGKGSPVAPPWDSDELSARLGIIAPKEERHTALGDARWARDIYDAVMQP
jgi:DNA polymerase III epsilon subunit-like protein